MAKKRKKRSRKKRKLESRNDVSKKQTKSNSPKKQEENKKKLSLPEIKVPRLWFWGGLALILLLATLMRFVTFPDTYKNGEYHLQGADAYVFVREAENIQHGGYPEKDPLLCYPEGRSVDPTLFPYVLAAAGKIIPIEMASAYSSPFFALLSFVAVFLLLRELFPKNDYAVLGGTALASMTGIQLYSRSYFGMGDYHILETFFSFFGLFAMVRAWRLNNYIWSIVAGVSFLLYVMAWFPSSIFFGILGIGLIIKYLYSKELPDKFYLHLIPIFAIPLLSSFFVFNKYILIVCLGMLFSIGLCEILRKQFSDRILRLGAYGGAVILAIILLYLIAPDIVRNSFKNIKILLFAGGLEQRVKEMESMWLVYSTAMKSRFILHGVVQVIALLAGVIGFYFALKHKQYVLVTAGVFWMILAYLHVRFEYYTVIFIGFGTAYLIQRWKFLLWPSVGMGVLFILGMVQGQLDTAAQFPEVHFKMAQWMNENLPESGVEPYGAYESDAQPDYGITMNWEYGYIYTHLGKRPVFTNPSHCHFKDASEFFTIDNEDEAVEFMKKNGLKYVAVDTPTYPRYYYHRQQSDLPLPKLIPVQTNSGTVQVISGDYYLSMFSRLYNYDAKGFDATQTIVLRNNQVFVFETYEEAQKDIKENGGEVFGSDLQQSPIDLKPLKHFKLVHTEGDWDKGVKLFEFVE